MRFTITRKLLALTLLSIAFVTCVGITGYWGIQKLDNAMDNIADSSVVLKNHMSADMMHDAIKSDVLAALVASEQKNTATMTTINNDFKQHATSFSESLQRNQTLVKSSELSNALNKTLPVLQSYISSAGNIIELAGNNRQSAIKQLAQFTRDFDALAIEMGSLTDLIENNARKMQQTGDQKVVLSSNTLLIFLPVSIIILSLCFWLIGVNITRPLAKLVLVAEQIADGDLTLQINSTSHDEIGQLSDAMEKMRGCLLDMISRISSTTNQLSAAAQEISVVTMQTSSNVQKQLHETDQVASAMHEMTATVQEVSNNITLTSTAASQANDETKVGTLVVSQTVQQIQDLEKQIDISADIINQLNTNSEQISSVLDVIKSIADQTNLLALNAAIEAARAGEQGRGFAVVADEVRTLAGRTQQSTEEINKMVDQLQSGSKMAVDAMTHSRQQTRLAVVKGNKAGENLAIISTSVAQINEMSDQIASAAEQQGAVTQEITTNIIRINDISNQSAEGAKQTSKAAQELAQMSSELQDLVLQFKVS